MFKLKKKIKTSNEFNKPFVDVKSNLNTLPNPSEAAKNTASDMPIFPRDSFEMEVGNPFKVDGSDTDPHDIILSHRPICEDRCEEPASFEEQMINALKTRKVTNYVDTVPPVVVSEENHRRPNIECTQAHLDRIESIFDMGSSKDIPGYYALNSCDDHSIIGVTKNGDIVEGVRGLMTGVALSSLDEGDFIASQSAVNILPTDDAGMRYVSVINGVAYDNGPVIDACFVGTPARCEGMYVPFNNQRAINDAITLLNSLSENNNGVKKIK